MASSQGEQNIRGLDIDKTVKGFALTEYSFKNQVTQSSTGQMEIRWYQETASDITATSPAKIANVAPGAQPTHVEHSWTRKTSYVKKYFAESWIDMEDQESTDIDVVARTLLRLTRAVVKQVDSDIFDVITESQSPSDINSITTSSVGGDTWDGSSQDPIQDILRAVRLIEENDYDTGSIELWLNPYDKESLLQWLIATKGSSIPNFSSERVRDGVLMELAGARVRVSNNVASDNAVVLLPAKACTWKSHTSTTSANIREEGIGTKYRVWELGVALLTDPKAVTLIQDTKA